MDRVSIALFELLQISVGEREKLTVILTPTEWTDMFSVMRKQAIFGVIFEAISQLSSEQRPPRNLILQGIAQSDLVARQNQLLNRRVLNMSRIMEEMCIPYCILKGQGVGLLYPVPTHRQPGDIDVWCDVRSRKELLEKVAARYKIRDTQVHHTHVDFFEDIKVDLHYIPTWLYAPWYNNRLKHFFSLEKSIQMNNRNEVGFNMPTIKFNLVYSLLHLFGHFMSSGIGLRQFMDYYYILMHSTEQDRLEAVVIIKNIGKKRFLSAVMYVMQTVFLLPDDYLLIKPNKRLGQTLVNEILIGGNFGYYNCSPNHQSRWVNSKGLFMRMFGFFAFAPSEVICSPFWKLWHYVWRKKNRYV